MKVQLDGATWFGSTCNETTWASGALGVMSFCPSITAAVVAAVVMSEVKEVEEEGEGQVLQVVQVVLVMQVQVLVDETGGGCLPLDLD